MQQIVESNDYFSACEPNEKCLTMQNNNIFIYSIKIVSLLFPFGRFVFLPFLLVFFFSSQTHQTTTIQLHYMHNFHVKQYAEKALENLCDKLGDCFSSYLIPAFFPYSGCSRHKIIIRLRPLRAYQIHKIRIRKIIHSMELF